VWEFDETRHGERPALLRGLIAFIGYYGDDAHAPTALVERLDELALSSTVPSLWRLRVLLSGARLTDRHREVLLALASDELVCHRQILTGRSYGVSWAAPLRKRLLRPVCAGRPRCPSAVLLLRCLVDQGERPFPVVSVDPAATSGVPASALAEGALVGRRCLSCRRRAGCSLAGAFGLRRRCHLRPPLYVIA
jgi:hypothetical protein